MHKGSQVPNETHASPKRSDVPNGNKGSKGPEFHHNQGMRQKDYITGRGGSSQQSCCDRPSPAAGDRELNLTRTKEGCRIQHPCSKHWRVWHNCSIADKSCRACKSILSKWQDQAKESRAAEQAKEKRANKQNRTRVCRCADRRLACCRCQQKEKGETSGNSKGASKGLKGNNPGRRT